MNEIVQQKGANNSTPFNYSSKMSRGYDIHEVNAFWTVANHENQELNRKIEELQRINRELVSNNGSLQTQLHSKNQDIKALALSEEPINNEKINRNALLRMQTAQNRASEMLNDAVNTSNTIVADAENDAQEIRTAALKYREEAEREINGFSRSAEAEIDQEYSKRMKEVEEKRKEFNAWKDNETAALKNTEKETQIYIAELEEESRKNAQKVLMDASIEADNIIKNAREEASNLEKKTKGEIDRQKRKVYEQIDTINTKLYAVKTIQNSLFKQQNELLNVTNSINNVTDDWDGLFKESLAILNDEKENTKGRETVPEIIELDDDAMLAEVSTEITEINSEDYLPED